MLSRSGSSCLRHAWAWTLSSSVAVSSARTRQTGQTALSSKRTLFGCTSDRTRRMDASSSMLLSRFRGGSGAVPTAWYSSSPSSSSSSSSSSSQLHTASTSTTIDPELIDPAEVLAVTESKLPTRDFGGMSYHDTKSSRASLFRVVFVLGGPGAGKGTQSALMEENYPTVHLSVGDLLRAEQAKDDSPHKELLEKTLVAGKIVPVEISLSLLQEAMKQKAQEMGQDIVFLVDGFPRNFDNLSGWSRYMSEVATLWGVLNYQCPLDVLEQRILERAKDSGRADDNLESVKKRFKTFEADTVPVIDTLRTAAQENDANWAVVDIRGDQPLEDVWTNTREFLDGLILHDVVSANAALLRAAKEEDLDAYKALCDPEWFDSSKNADAVMRKQEGDGADDSICNAKLEVMTGKRVAISYDRVIQGERLREKRIWSHKGKQGWRNIHFSRIPIR